MVFAQLKNTKQMSVTTRTKRKRIAVSTDGNNDKTETATAENCRKDRFCRNNAGEATQENRSPLRTVHEKPTKRKERKFRRI